MAGVGSEFISGASWKPSKPRTHYRPRTAQVTGKEAPPSVPSSGSYGRGHKRRSTKELLFERRIYLHLVYFIYGIPTSTISTSEHSNSFVHGRFVHVCTSRWRQCMGCRRLRLPERDLHPRRYGFSLFWPDVTRCVQRYIHERDRLTIDGTETQSLEILISRVNR